MARNKFKNIYEPAEDSKLLLKNSLIELKKINSKNKKLDIIEIGVGSGYVISNIEKLNPKNNYFGADINIEAINFTKKNSKNIKLEHSNLFEKFENKKFDLILFNTPYFPVEENEKFENLNLKDRAIYGGKKGWETIEKFIIASKDKFKNNGFAIMIFSSLSNFDQIKKILEENLFSYEILEIGDSFFEKIYCLKFFPLKILEELKNKNISNINFLDKGKHSIILNGTYKTGESKNEEIIIIKVGKNKDIQIENKFLKKLKNEFFTPKLYFENNTYSIREKVNGDNIKEFLNNQNAKNIEIILNKILEITLRLDELKINKQEMTNPYKHLYIDSKFNIKMIDYERCLYTNKPKNTTQFIQYIRRNINLLKNKNILIDENKLFEISKKIKKNPKSFQIKLEDLKLKNNQK